MKRILIITSVFIGFISGIFYLNFRIIKNGAFLREPNLQGAIPWLIVTIAIPILFVLICKLLFKAPLRLTALTVAITLFATPYLVEFSLIASPTVSLYFHNQGEYRKVLRVKNKIKQSDLPFKLDLDVSKQKTKSYRTASLVISKSINGEITKKEVQAINDLFDTKKEDYLFFLIDEKQNIIVYELYKNKIEVYCSSTIGYSCDFFEAEVD